MGVTYDKRGNCTTCGRPGTGFVEDGLCNCLEEQEARALWQEFRSIYGPRPGGRGAQERWEQQWKKFQENPDALR